MAEATELLSYLKGYFDEIELFHGLAAGLLKRPSLAARSRLLQTVTVSLLLVLTCVKLLYYCCSFACAPDRARPPFSSASPPLKVAYGKFGA